MTQPKEPMFPILNDVSIKCIPWAAIAPHDAQAQKNHGGQTLRRLAQRGGLAVYEAVAVMTGSDPWKRVRPSWARAKLMCLVWDFTKARISSLENDLRLAIEYRTNVEQSDDRCYSNGRMQQLNEEIAALKKKIEEFS